MSTRLERLALLNLRVRLPVGCDTLEWSPRYPLSPFLFGMDFFVGTCFKGLFFFGFVVFWPVFFSYEVEVFDCSFLAVLI